MLIPNRKCAGNADAVADTDGPQGAHQKDAQPEDAFMQDAHHKEAQQEDALAIQDAQQVDVDVDAQSNAEHEDAGQYLS